MSENLTLQDLQGMTEAGLTAKQAAEVLNVDPRTISRAIQDGSIPAIRLGRKVIIPRIPFIKMLTGETMDVAV